MKTQIEILKERINNAILSTMPRTVERNKALKQIKWRLESETGLCAGLGKDYAAALVQPESAQVFDGRDNEIAKQSFYQTALGVNFAIVLL